MHKLSFTCTLLFISHLALAIARVQHGNERLGEVCNQGPNLLGKCEEIRSCVDTGGTVKWNTTVHLCEPRGSHVIACCRRPELVAKELCDTWKTYWGVNYDGNKCVHDKPLIVGGVEATLGEFPHLVSLGKELDNGDIKWECGGTLVSPHYVLTAAHCVNLPKTQYHIVVGEHDLTQVSKEVLPPLQGGTPKGIYKTEEVVQRGDAEVPVEQRRMVLKIIHYPEYVFRYHDIALLLLDKPVVFTKRVLPACLPLKRILDFQNKDFIAMGWGRLHSGSSQVSQNKLLKVAIPWVDSARCYLQFKDKSIATRGITSDQLCAGMPGKDTCQGDSGGPLILEKGKMDSCEQTVIGITSFGEGCGKVGVYTRVSVYLDWITAYLAPDYVHN